MKNVKGLIPIVIVGVIFIIAAALVASYWWYQQKAQDLALANTAQQLITDFDSCAAAGYPIMESHPRRCSADGKTYTEIINQNGNTNTVSCRHYFDGCNTCTQDDNTPGIFCTTRYCTPEERQPYRCLDDVNNNSNINTNASTNTNADQTAGWKTYTNATYGFSLQYPAESKVLEANDVMLFIGKAGEKVTQISDRNGGREFRVWYIDLTAQQFIDAYNADEDTISQVTKPKKSVTFSGQSVDSVVAETAIGLESTFYFLENNGKRFSIEFVSTNNDHKQILSTFTLFADTASWKTYTNTENGYTVKYPKEWKVEEGVQSIVKLFSSPSRTTGPVGNPVEDIRIQYHASISVLPFYTSSYQSLRAYAYRNNGQPSDNGEKIYVETLQLDGVEAYKVNDQNAHLGTAIFILYIPLGNGVLTASSDYKTPITNSIASSFVFMD